MQALKEYFKTRHKNVSRTALSISTMLLLAACSSSSDSNSSSSNDSDSRIEIPITIPFSAQASGLSVDCAATFTGLGVANASGSILDFRFYVHNVTLISDSGGRYEVTLDDNNYQGGGVGLVDFQDMDDTCSGAVASTNKQITGSVTADEDVVFNDLEFTIGVPANLNHEDPSAATGHLNILGMHWNWQGGYKHIRMDVAVVGGAVPSWNFHLGSTGCTPDPTDPLNTGAAVSCDRTNLPIVSLANFDPASDTVLVDYGELVSTSDVSANAGGAPGCMSGQTDPECAAIFSKLGMDVTLDDSTENYQSGTQTVFSVM